METQSPWMTGTEANVQSLAINGFKDMAISIFGAIGGNSLAQTYRFKHDDIVVQETSRDNRAFIAAGATALLLLAVIIILIMKK